MSVIWAIDPGTVQSGFCIYERGIVFSSGVKDNEELVLEILGGSYNKARTSHMAIEMVASYGMAVGKETFRTVWWAGRFAQAWLGQADADRLLEVYRAEVKTEICKSQKANDSNIRQAIIDRYGGKDAAIGKKATPGPLYGVKSHAWAALAVAITAEARLAAQAPV
jgi:hypothetical protein